MSEITELLENPKKILFTFARVALGLVFIAHGYQKFVTYGIDTVAQNFAASGTIPFPTFSAYFAATTEFLGGILLVLGLLVPLASLFLIITMIGAIVTVHGAHGFFITNTPYAGWELPLIYIIALIAVGVVDYGSYGFDGFLLKKITSKKL